MTRSLLLVALLLSVAALVSGQCNSGSRPSCSASPATVPTAWYNLTFSSAVSGATGYGWEATDASDASCSFMHQGITTFTGGASTTAGQYIDLSASTGVNAVGTNTLSRTIGGAGSGSLSDGTMGWSFEWTMKSGAEAGNGKIFAIGAGQAIWNIFAGPDSGATGATFGVYDGASSYGNGHSGILEIINPVLTTQWYHVVAVVQQVAVTSSSYPQNITHQGAYFVYVNGQLLNITGVGVYLNSLVVQAVARPNAYIARSDWAADPFWTGILDTFRIYDRALTQAQVTTLYQGEMGGCPVTTSSNIAPFTTATLSSPNILPRSSSATIPATYWSATFGSSATTSNPCTNSGGCSYTWEATSPTDNAANSALHTGIVSLNGASQWIDLSQTSGPTSAVRTAFPQTIGGGANGWSFEITFKPNVLENWGKLFDIGSTRTNLGQCSNDIVLGWDASNTQFQFDVCDSANHEFQTGDAVGMLQTGVWYHVVAVFAPVAGDATGTLANYFTYINGYLYTVEANFLYPQSVVRQNAWLGRSGWYANGDANFSAEVDTFNVYNAVLTDAQVLSLATTALGLGSTSGGGSGSCTAKPTCSSSTVVPTAWYNLTFSTNPGASGYGWEATDASDNGCAFQHQGITTFTGGATTGQYIDLSMSTGANAVGTNTLSRTIGGAGSGSLSDGTMGWSFEWTMKSGTEASNGKIFAIGAGQAIWNIFAGPDGGATGATFGVYDNAGNYANGHSGILEIINPVLTTQWYHVVAVVQQVAVASSGNPLNITHQGAYFVYVNGQLLNFNGVGVYLNSLIVQAVARPNAYIARSDWAADPFWTGILDTFRIYDRALTQAQVTTLYQGEMGGCPVTTSSNIAPFTTAALSSPNILPRSTSTTIPSTVWSATFNSNPCSLPGGTGCSYTWEANSPTDSSTLQGLHTGLINLNGAQNWVDLNQVSGAYSAVSTAFPIVGGGSTGWSFEITFKPNVLENWAKLFDIGSTRSATAMGSCVNDIVLGWDSNNAQFQFDVCDSTNHEFQTGDAVGNLVQGAWYHVVAVIAPSTADTTGTLANYFTYVNGFLYTVEANFFYPQAVTRQNAWLGRSGWYANGDLNFSVEVDTFNVYGTALNDAQVLTLATAALGSAAVSGGGGTTTGTCTAKPTCSSSTVVPTAWYNLTFSTNPGASGYGWEATDASDNGCAFQHQGITTFTGGATTGQYIDLSMSTGANAVGTNTLSRTIGGAGSGSLSDGTMGWSFEWTMKSGTEASNGKIFAIGAGQAIWNIFAGPDGGATGATFGVYDNAGNYANGHSGILEIINPVLTTQWYHVVAVVQQVAVASSGNPLNITHQGAYFVYVNGQLLNFNGVGVYLNSLIVQAVARPNAYIARSDWAADPFWTGILDTFRIYDRALTQAQVTTLYQGEMGGCPVTTSSNIAPFTTAALSSPNILPRSTSTTIPSTVWSATFNSNPCSLPGGTGCSYTWEANSPTDSSTLQGLHTGLINLNGAQNRVDLNQVSGAYSAVSTAFPIVGGGSTGWSFEITFKPNVLENWAKLFDIGSTRSATAMGSCVNDIVLGWDSNNAQFQFDVCDSTNHEFQTGDAVGNLVQGAWYHVVAVIAPSTADTTGTLANYFTYVNGFLYTVEANFFYPQAVTRQNAWLGRSGWYANGDLNFSVEVDTFNVYGTALNDAQVLTLATAALGSAAVSGGGGTTTGTCTAKPTCSSSTVVPTAWYNLTFSTNPGASGYGWEATDASDNGCAFQHQGITTFTGGATTGQYIDLSMSTGANAVGTNTLSRTIGGAGSGSLSDGTMGWSFEWTMKSGTEASNGKIFAIGAGQAIWNIFAGPDGGATGATFGVYDNAGNYANGHSGILEIINPVLTTQWYHVVAVVQQVAVASSGNPLNITHQGAYFVYVNGQLLNFNGVGVYLNSLIVQAVARPNAYIARSDWAADPFWTGILDTFRIYDRALTQAQVTTLYQGEMGGCPVTTSSNIAPFTTAALSSPNILPRSTSTTIPSTVWSATFNSNPCSLPGGTGCSYTWEANSPTDSSTLQGLHTGLINLNGAQNWVDLNQVSGAYSAVSTAFPIVGGGSTGWSFEITFKPNVLENWAKLFDIGSTRSATAMGSCVNDIVLGWDSNNAQFQFDVCDSTNHEFQTGDAVGNLVQGAWYHVVAVIAPSTADTTGTLANYFTYVNGFLYTVEANFFYPQAVTRQNAWLGRSGWYANGDLNFSVEVDTFNVYGTALNDAQVLTLATAALGSAAVSGGGGIAPSSCAARVSCSASPATVPAAWYNLTFTSNPGASGYGWENTDLGDAGCVFQHQGIVTFTGGATSGQYIDLNSNTGANAVGTNTLAGRTIGGAGSGQLIDGTMGWSFEWTMRSGAESSNGKIFAIGAGQAVWNIFAGPDGGATGANFGVYDGASSYNNGHSGIVEFINPISTSTWYHVVAVVQQITTNGTSGHGAYFVYVNGVLLNYTGVGIYLNSLLVQAQARPNAYIARSDWSADPFWTGILDTFRIYDRALTQTQVTTLYQGEMGGCPVPTSITTIQNVNPAPNILPRSTSASIPSGNLVYTLTFDSNPCPSGSTCNYGWESVSPADNAANQRAHTGILTLNGQQQWVDMAATSGAYALTTGNQAFPTIGGGTGWTFELVVKPNILENWGKIIDIGSTRSNLGQCVNDIVLGWDAGNSQWQFDVCDGANHEFQTGDAFGNIIIGNWYHLVAVIAQTPTGGANYITYVNGQLYTAEPNFYYPQAVARQNAWLGKSGWYANGDANFSGEVDLFNIYNIALNDAQIAARAAQFIVTPTSCSAVPSCSSNPTTVPTAWYNVTFTSNPVLGISAPTYTWAQTVSTDSTCQFQHRGLATFAGGPSSGGQYVDLNQASGASSAGVKIPGVIGGTSSGSVNDGTAGWSFEWTFLSGSEAVNGKIFAIGAGEAVWNIFAGPDGSATGANFGVYDGQGNYNNGQSGIVEFVNPTSTTQWYHVVAVVQQTFSNVGNLHGAYFLYVNGQQLNYTGVGIYLNALSIQAQNRPNAYLAKSDWAADPYWAGAIDTFRIYDRALTQSQVTTLYQGEMGGCAVPTQTSTITGISTLPNLTPRTGNSLVTPWYSQSFDTNPCPSGTTCNYGWESTSSTDTANNQLLYKGIVTLNGKGQYIDLNAQSGPQSVGTKVLPTIGGGDAGWTFELILKPGNASNWAKVMDIGSTRNPTTLAQCANDIVLGWDASTSQWQFDLCDNANHEYQTGDAFGNLVAGQWYHLVASIAPTLNKNGLANYFTYINGVLYTMETNFLYPQAVPRQNAWLGLSGWYANGDANFTGEINSFNIYNTAVSDQQAASLYQQNYLGQTVNWGSSSNNAGGSSSSSSLSGGAIAGIVIGSVVGALLLLVLCWCFCAGAMSRGGAKKTGNTGYDTHADQSQIRSEQHHEGEGEGETHGEDVEMA